MTEKDKSAKPDAAELNELRKWLRDNGCTSAQANQAVKVEKKRSEIADDIRSWLKTRLKKV